MNADPDERVYPGGEPYSGRNRIPNIKQFVESLDRDKKRRDAQVEASGHIPTKKPGKNRRTVRDPVTGKDVKIEDISSHHMKAASNPTVCIPHYHLVPTHNADLSAPS